MDARKDKGNTFKRYGEGYSTYGGLNASLTVENNYLPRNINAYNVTRQMPISMHISLPFWLASSHKIRIMDDCGFQRCYMYVCYVCICMLYVM